MGIALTAAALSVTVGVLVGAVITIGNHARSQSAGPVSTATAPVLPSASQVGESVGASALAQSDPVQSDPVQSDPVQSDPPPSTAPMSPVRTSARRSVPPATVVTIYLTTPTPTSPPANPPTPSPQITPGPSSGAPVAGQPCPALGAEGTASGGSNVFCQRDFATGSLTWRAVVNGGGCLNREMTGIGVDGRNYACRPYGAHLDRWRPAR